MGTLPRVPKSPKSKRSFFWQNFASPAANVSQTNLPTSSSNQTALLTKVGCLLVSIPGPSSLYSVLFTLLLQNRHCLAYSSPTLVSCASKQQLKSLTLASVARSCSRACSRSCTQMEKPQTHCGLVFTVVSS